MQEEDRIDQGQGLQKQGEGRIDQGADTHEHFLGHSENQQERPWLLLVMQG